MEYKKNPNLVMINPSTISEHNFFKKRDITDTVFKLSELS